MTQTLHTTQSELIRALRESDLQAFRAVYDQYYESLYRFAFSRLRSPDSARDVLQDVFLRLWQQRHRLNPEKSMKAYLFQIAYHRIVDRLREISKIKTDKAEHTINKSIDSHIDMQQAIEKLPEKMKITFIMNRYYGFKYREIAEMLKISEKTVEKRMSKALKKLRDSL
ncbi:RNA polymerase sigma-70 factor [candidate division KSB1 bacterium]|nr:RNA polymerase sigma-70 factor [candidate division KSB1 bacterium]